VTGGIQQQIWLKVITAKPRALRIERSALVCPRCPKYRGETDDEEGEEG
jgi:hypothetical protein